MIQRTDRNQHYSATGQLLRDEQVQVDVTERANETSLREQITTTIQIFENADANWATLTAAQRNDVLKLAVRSLARLGRIINNQLDAT